MWQLSPASLWRFIFFLSLATNCSASYLKALYIALFGCWPPPNSGAGKRSIGALEDTLWVRDLPANQVLEKLKRQANPSTCGCLETKSEFYDITALETYMATPFGRCDIRASTSNLCPTDHLCACQNNETSICLPTAIQTITECGTPYSGPTTHTTTQFTWLLSSPLSDFAFPTEQCGGTLAAAATIPWEPTQTVCPATQSCVCQTASRFSRCIDTTDIASNGIPATCLTCKYEFNYNLPPPSATARLGGQCGGRCWTGPTNCPTSATCFTETLPTPGGYAECALSNPSRRLKVRQEGHEVLDVNLPARVQAMATPIYF
ncbi:hypothetical protein TWF730_008601 [Orbilia blumenaviensis]|uniref:CBM1 domain-containing protein n=1 Tax=Orbilia blumenaviensis TaxID=1796055 RepID=A0AAV9V5Y2_9PEZI